MNLVFSAEARADLVQIGRWFGQEFPERGRDIIETLRARCLALTEQPRLFPIVRITDGEEIRKVVVQKHLIIYALIDDQLLIQRVVHGATNWAADFLERDHP